MTTQEIRNQLKRISSHAERQSTVSNKQDVGLLTINNMIDRLEQIKREVEKAQDEDYPLYLEYVAELKANSIKPLNFEAWKDYNEEKSRIFDKLMAAR